MAENNNTAQKTAPPSRAQAALRRLIILVIAAVVLVIFSYGWTITNINLERPQEPVRQQNVGNALRELLSPNVLEQDYTVDISTTTFLMDCSAGSAGPEQIIPAEGEPYVTIEPACGSGNELVTLRGFNFYPSSLARINWIGTDGERRIRQVIGTGQDNFTTRPDGTFEVQIEVPRIRASAGQTHTIEVQDRVPSGTPRFTDTTHLVIEKMIETIFLALIATTISILPSAFLSFLAAHNLMRPIRMTLGNLLVTFILLPVGWALGSWLLGQIGSFGIRALNGDLLGGAASATVLIVAAVASSRRLPDTGRDANVKLRGIIRTLIVAVAAMLLLGVFGGLGLLANRVFTEGILSHVGNFIGTIGRLIELAIAPLGGLVGAFALSSIGTTLTRDALKHVSAPLTNILGLVLGVLAGAILLGLCAAIGMSAAWVGLLTPIVAAMLAAPLLPSLFSRFVSSSIPPTPTERFSRTLLALIGAAAAFYVTFTVLNVGRAMIEGTLPPQDASIDLLGMGIPRYVWLAMTIGAVIGGIGGLIGGTKATFPVGSVLYNITRTILNGLRSIEPLIMGLVFVIWVGIGPFAGVLALTLHSIASLGKLYSEQIENIDAGPIEALQSTGANQLQTIMYAVVPQIIPPYIAFTMYRWDINVRMSTIIGFVGGGGVGFLLQQQINLLRYRDAGVAVLAIAIVVSILDYASASIRERYV